RALLQLEDVHARLRESSRRDGLTGLFNRTWFHEAFQRIVAEARENRSPVSLLMVDLDHFKAINDRHGHLAGDECLRWAAGKIAGAAGSDALVARFGGEEFVVALPGHGRRGAVEVAEAIRGALADGPCMANGTALHISASIGVHTLPAETTAGSDDAFEIADRAMYAAKRSEERRVGQAPRSQRRTHHE